MSRARVGIVALALALGALARADAGVLTFATPIGGFVPDSRAAAGATGAAFLAAAGGSIDFATPFDTDRFGGPLPAFGGAVDGGIFSDHIVFSSAVGAYGGSSSSDVRYSGSGWGSELGPIANWDGVLEVDFLARGYFASAVGFGPVAVGNNAGEVYRVYDQTGSLVLTLAAPYADTFQFVGFVGTAGTLISRVEIDGQFFAIQDIQYDAEAVPEPGTILLLGSGIASLALRRRRRQG